VRDLKYSARMFLKAPSFTITAVAALALGIATNTAIFSVVNTVLLKPFAYPDPERVVMFQNILRDVRFGSTAPTEFNWWLQQSQSFQDISAYDFSVANWPGESFPEQIPTMHTSVNFFRLCGAIAELGRTFTAEDDLPNAPKNRGTCLRVLEAAIRRRSACSWPANDPQRRAPRNHRRSGPPSPKWPDHGTIHVIRRYRSRRPAGRVSSISD